MKKKNTLLIGLIIFLLFYFFGLFFTISRLYINFDILNVIHPIFIAFVILFFVFFFNIMQDIFSNKLSAVLYNFSYLVFAYACLFILVSIIFEGFRLIFYTSKKSFIFQIIILIITTFIFIISFLNSLKYTFKTINLESKKIKKNIKLIHLSDLHLFGYNSKKKFEKIFLKAIKLNPDYFVITGDLFDKPGKIPLNTLEITKKYNLPIIYVHGNHDLLYGEKKVLQLLNFGKIINLDSKKIIFSKHNISFTGVRYKLEKDFLFSELNKIKLNQKNYNILLYHEPIDIPVAENKKFDLMLSGHTHGGQAFPITLIVKIIYKYINGLYTFKNMNLIVSPGTCFWGPKIRLGTNNQIILINLNVKK